MKKRQIFIGIAIILCASFVFFVIKNLQSNKDSKTVTMNIQGKNVTLLVADEAAEWTYGLMNRRTLKEADGMVFIFPDKQMRSFWNMNTFMDLTVVWMDGNKVIGTSVLPSIEKSKQYVTVQSPAPADRVVELVR